MRFVTLECPRCGAKIKANTDIDFVVCEYCDSMLQVNIGDNELSEEARLRSREKKADALAERIRKCIPVIGELAAQSARVRDLTAEKEQLSGQLSALGRKKLMRLPELKIAGGVLAGLVLLALLFNQARALLILLAVVWAGYYLYAKHYNKQLRSDVLRIREDYESHIEALEQAEERIREIRENYDFSFIPNDYRKESILRYMVSMLERRRAFNIHEAIERYEEHCIQKKEEQYRAEQLELQRQQVELQRRQFANSQEQQYSIPNAKNGSKGRGLEYTAAALGVLAVGAKVAKDFKKWM